jgi:hypothetical protein
LGLPARRGRLDVGRLSAGAQVEDKREQKVRHASNTHTKEHILCQLI